MNRKVKITIMRGAIAAMAGRLAKPAVAGASARQQGTRPLRDERPAVEGKLFFDWALAGIDPALTGIEAGKLPKGAVAGQNSFGKAGYEICPTPGQAETYVFALYALPEALSPSKGFDPAALRQQVQAISRNAGLLAASYGRG